MNEDYIGFIRLWAGTFIPMNYLACEGQLLPVSQNQALAHVIKNTYGGDGVTTFALPDLRGRIPIGSQGTPNTGLTIGLGSAGGEETHVLTLNEMPFHMHVLQANPNAGNTNNPNNAVFAAPVYVKSGQSVNTKVNAFKGLGEHSLANSAVSVVGQNLGHENRQPFVGLRYIICTSGVYPQRS